MKNKTVRNQELTITLKYNTPSNKALKNLANGLKSLYTKEKITQIQRRRNQE